MFNIALLLVGIRYASSILSNTYPTCGDCWCIPGNDGLDECPTWKPQTRFAPSTINNFKAKVPTSIYTLECNPYYDANCTTTPPQIMLDSEEAVCAYEYTDKDTCSEYKMTTFKDRKSALEADARITHTGSCGLCSTAQDLALYLTEDFTQAGKICATKGVFNEEAGLNCYIELGMTPDCAKIWNYDGLYDSKQCGKICMGDITSPNNGPAPECALSSCLECDEEEAGPIFSAYGGRTRRRSGLLSEIVRNCDSIARIVDHTPC